MPYTRRRMSLATLLLSLSATIVAASVASAQVKPKTDTAKTAVKPTVKHRAGAAKSEVRVPVQKKVIQQGGEVAPAVAPPVAPVVNQDSIDRANRLRDSLAAAAAAAAAERDRLAAAARAERDRLARIAAEEARRDSIARAEEAARLLRERLGRFGFYWGLAAGPTLPVSDFNGAYKAGFNVTLPFGWDFRDSPLGIRADAAYDLMDGRYVNTALMSNVQVYSLNADAKLRMRMPVLSHLDRFYLVGGGGIHRVVSNGGDNPGAISNGKSNNGFSTTFSGASTKFGWNAGAGMSFGFGRSALFVESRYFDHSTDNTYMSKARFIPIVLGLTF